MSKWNPAENTQIGNLTLSLAAVWRTGPRMIQNQLDLIKDSTEAPSRRWLDACAVFHRDSQLGLKRKTTKLTQT